MKYRSITEIMNERDAAERYMVEYDPSYWCPVDTEEEEQSLGDSASKAGTPEWQHAQWVIWL